LELNIKHYYEQAKNLRKGLLVDNEESVQACYSRIQKYPLWSTCSVEELQHKKFSLNDIKQVIAVEQGYSSWVELKIDLENKISQLQEDCDGVFIVGNCDHEAGDVVKDDIVYLGKKGESYFAVDMESQELYEVKIQKEKMGIILKHREESLAENEEVIEPPDDETWCDWSSKVLDQYLKK